MSAGRSSRKRERKTYQDEGSLDVSDDFQEAAPLFRLPKRLLISKSQENPKKNLLNRGTQEASLSCRRTPSERNPNIPQPDSNLVRLGSETSVNNSDLQEIEKTLCANSEKLCPSCKLIVPCDVFADHFKDCIQRYKLNKEGCVKQFPVPGREGETSEQEKQQPVLPCPVCKKAFKSRTQRVIHIKTCAQDYGLTSEQLLLASRLLVKQSEEWNELGLPTSLQLHTIGPKAHNSKYNRDLKDPDIAMALALSRSIAEEKMESRFSREEKLLALGLEDIVEEDRKVSPILLPPPNSATCIASQLKKRGKDRKGCSQFQKSVLATRSVEERERLISEKVAVILTSEDTSIGGWQHGETKEKSGKLTSVINKECQLWEIARGSANEPLHSFYVPELEPYIKPKKATIGSLLKKLSQVPGRLNTTALHSMDEESESECEMEEATAMEEFCTQMALAGLIGSQEDLDITTEMDGEQATEGMESQGFIIPSLGTKTPYDSDFRFCKLNMNNIDAVEAMERNSGDLMEVNKAEEDGATFKENYNQKNNEDISQSTEGSLESVRSVEALFTGSCKLGRESSHSENISSDYPVNSEEKQEPQKIQQYVNIPVNQPEYNNEPAISKTLCSITCAKSSVNEYEGTEKQPKNSPLLSSEYGKEDIYTSPTRKCYEYKEKNLATLGMGFSSKNLMSLSGGNDSCTYLKTGVVPDHKTATCPIKEEILTKHHISHFKSDCMIQRLIQNWNDLLESGMGSDVTITTLEGSSLRAHSLVLMARCPELYKESEAHGKLIKWSKVPQKAVHQFLSYLYTGACEITTPGDPLWIELYDIGLQYDCNDLVSHMKLLYKAKNSTVKTPVVCPERDEEPLPIDKELDKSTKISRNKQAVYLEKDSRTGRDPTYSKSYLISSMGVNTDKFSNVGELKFTNHYDEKVHEQNESSYANKGSQDYLKSGHEEQANIECLGDQRAQSPDLFDESLCAEKSCIISPVLNSPPLIVFPHHSPIMEIAQLQPKELEEVSYVLSKTSSPCKSVSSLGDREDMEILPSSPLTSILPTTSKKEVLEGDPDIPDMRSVDKESKVKSPLSKAYDNCELGDFNNDDNDVIDLTQSGSKCHAEESILDLPSVSKCQTETEWHNCTDKVGIMDDGNKELLHCESENAHMHYISNIWNDFDVDSSMTATEEELHSTFEKLEANINKRSSINGPELHLSTDAQSTSHKIAPMYISSYGDHQEDIYSEKLKSAKSQEGNSLRCKTKCTVSPQVIGETSFVEFFEGHSGDEILVNAATEMEESDAVYQSRNQTEPTSSTAAHASYSLVLTPRQNCNAEKKIVTPKPDYIKMKSPELKKELQKYGICALGRRKAVAVLHHIYEQTHPLVTDSEAESSFSQTPQRNSGMAVGGPDSKKFWVRKNRRYESLPEMQKSNKNNLMEKEVVNNCNVTMNESKRDQEDSEDGHVNSSLTSTSSSEGSDEGIFGDAASLDEDEEILSSAQQAGLVSQVQEIITSRTDLYRKVLLYEPIFVENLHATLKANRIKCSMQALLDALDEMCVIVRTQANQKNKGRTKSSKRKITSPKKRPQEPT